MFTKFSKVVDAQLTKMGKDQLFVVDVTRDELWQIYLESFPAGTDPMLVERTEHDCNCCKNFIRDVGAVITIKNGVVTTVWDVETVAPYDVVARKMSEFVKEREVKSPFFTQEQKVGAKTTRGNNTTTVYNHFYGKVSVKHISNESSARTGAAITSLSVFQRGLEFMQLSSLDMVLDLIDTDNLYRGDEFRGKVAEFSAYVRQYSLLNSKEARDLYAMEKLFSSVATFRNSVIGTLVTDLDDGISPEVAVKRFEAKVAPTNYKRSKSVITGGMVDAAMKTITSLGLEASIQRRFATSSDVKVQDVIWANRSTQAKMKNSLHDLLMADAVSIATTTKGSTDIYIGDFLSNVVPNSHEIEAMVSNSQESSMVSLVAPKEETDERILSWNNGFSWSYANNLAASSIKQKVKRAGGNVDALLRVSLSWHNTDDLDIHVIEPNSNHIYFGNKGGKLDVDMNVHGESTDPVENVSWTHPKDGVYRIAVDNYASRDNFNVSSTVEVEYNGQVTTFSMDKKILKSTGFVEIVLTNGKIEFKKISKDVSMSVDTTPKNIWGINTETYVPVEMIMKSPNHWEGSNTGQKQYFFMLNGCNNPESTRGIYNEFLRPELHKHRKVFEVLGGKTKCEVSDDQLSGIGLALKTDKLSVRVDGRPYTINF